MAPPPQSFPSYPTQEQMAVVARTANVDTIVDEESTPLLISVHTGEYPSRLAHNSHLRPHTSSRATSAAVTMASFFWRVGALYGASAVALGAFGSHGLKKRVSDPQKIASWTTAAHYQLIHSVVVMVARGHPVAASLMTAGMTFFSGSIYALILDPEHFKWMGPVTPVGGLCFILGWLTLAFTRGASIRL